MGTASPGGCTPGPLLATGAFAASATTQASPSTSQTQTQTRARSPLTVTYYAGDPLAGGKRLSSITVQPQPRSTTTPANPFANIPAGATYVTIASDHGTRVLTVKDAQTRTFAERGGRGGRHARGRGDHGSRFGGQDRRAERTNDRDAVGVHLPGLRDASSVAFYATDPLAGGKAQSTIKLSDPRTTAQQQAITQAAANAKYALVTRDGETRIINLSVQSPHVH